MEKIWTIGSILQWTTKFFQDKGLANGRLDAEVLLAEVLGLRRIELYTNYAQPLQESERIKYRECVQKRAARVPVAYITGHKEFYGLDFTVTENVLIPRAETEFLVEHVLETVKNKETAQVLEIGTGSGALITAILFSAENISAVAVDISQQALEIAKLNAAKFSVEQRVQFLHGDLFAPLKTGNGENKAFDIIISNPPYLSGDDMTNMQAELRYEPQLALFGGEDGLDCYRRILTEACTYLRKDGLLMLEIGSEQAEQIRHIANSTGKWQLEKIVQDYAGLNRVLVLTLN